MKTSPSDKPYKCTFEDCGMSFINKQLLTRHSRFHGVEIPVYTCKMCNKEVASKYHLKSHMKTHNDQVECQLCKSIFETRDELKDHYQAKHVPYPCSQCDKMFTLPRYLKMHEKVSFLLLLFFLDSSLICLFIAPQSSREGLSLRVLHGN